MKTVLRPLIPTLVFSLSLAAATRSAAALPATADSLAWLAGHWRGTSSEGAELDSYYSTPEGGVVLGTNKELKGGRCVFIDLEVFREKDGGLLLVPHPNGQRSKDVFPLTAFDPAARKATFSNPQHDWPQVFVYQRLDDDRLLIVLSGPGEGGKELKVEYAFKRKP